MSDTESTNSLETIQALSKEEMKARMEASAARIRARFAEEEFLRTARHSKVVAPATRKIPAGASGRGKKTIHTATVSKIQKPSSRARIMSKVARTKVAGFGTGR